MSASSSFDESLLKLALDVLKTLSEAGSTVDRMRRILTLIRETLELELVGLRLETGDKAPTYLIDGAFPSPAGPPVQGATPAPSKVCICRAVGEPRQDSSSPGLAEGGSYWTADGKLPQVSERVPAGSAECLSDCLCQRKDWQSLAVMALRVDGHTAGVLQLLDSRPGRLSARTVATIEQVGSALCACLQMDRLEQELRRYRFESAENQTFDGQSLQSQKLEAVGTLAGGIAHDFNNILWIITGNTELALNALRDDHPVRDNLVRVEEACQRAKDLVMQILSFSRPADQEFKPLKISSVVRESLKLLRSSIPSTIEIRKVISAESAMVLADLSQINQALLNLYTNAAEAMRQAGGVLEVSLVDMDLSEAEARQQGNIPPGRFAVLSVADTGPGIDPAIVQRIFDPYFSAGKESAGLGMGLAVVRGIVKNHGGAVRVQSEPGRGATFHLFLPCLVEMPDDGGRHADKGGLLPRGQGRVLWVDDEKGVLEMGRQMLFRLGYRVTTCNDPRKALALFKTDPRQYDVVITDQTMPGITGGELARRMLGIRPDTAIILCTGYSENFSETDAKAMGIREYLLKPLDMEFLARTVKRVSEGA